MVLILDMKTKEWKMRGKVVGVGVENWNERKEREYNEEGFERKRERKGACTRATYVGPTGNRVKAVVRALKATLILQIQYYSPLFIIPLLTSFPNFILTINTSNLHTSFFTSLPLSPTPSFHIILQSLTLIYI